MSRDTKIEIRAGGNAVLKGVAVGDGATASSVENAWPEGADAQFAELRRLIADAHVSGVIDHGQVERLSREVGGIEKDLKKSSDAEKKENAGLKLGKLAREFNEFCGDERGKSVAACAKALSTIFGISMAVLGLPH